MGILDTAGASAAAPTATYETVRTVKTDPTDTRKRYGIDKRVSDGALMLRIETLPVKAEADTRVKHVPLAPVARAIKLGVID